MLTKEQAATRFGMSLAEAHEVRDRAAAACGDMAAARAAWTTLGAELRDRPSPHHPELIRFRMLQAIAGGAAIPAALESARAFAFQPEA